MSTLLSFLTLHLPDAVALFLMMAGLYLCMTDSHLIRKLVGLGIFQTSVLLFYISLGWVEGGASPILRDGVTLYVNPLPQVLMLTAIVVGVATLAVGLAIAVRIQKQYGTMEEPDILAADAQAPAPAAKKRRRIKAKA